MTTAQRKEIFGRCKSLGMSDDDRRALICGLTGKESTKELTDKETESVIGELRKRCGSVPSVPIPPEKRNPKAYKPAVPGMMTTEQQSLAWRYIYRLRELDEKPRLHDDGTPVTPGERMAGAIYKVCGITTKSGENIFKWVSFKDGEKLIEKLKQYVNTAEKKAKRSESSENR